MSQDDAREKLKTVDAELEKSYRALEGYKYELQRSQEQVRASVRTCYELKHERQRLAETNQSLLHELQVVNKRLEETKAQLEKRGKDLIGMQTFLTKADSLSIPDIVQRVDALNEEIFQAAASLGECIARKKYDLTEVQLSECFAFVSDFIGTPLASIVVDESRKPEEEPANPLLVLVVLQAFLAYFCVLKIRAWTTDDGTINTSLKQIYEGIRDNEEPMVSGRWRALTRKNLPTNSDSWMLDLTGKLSTVFQLCGWDATQEHREAFEKQLGLVFKGVHDARSALGELFTSADLEAATIRAGVPFKKEYMEEVYGDGDDHKGGPQVVVATTGIGVRKALPREHRYEYVMLPKVILESSLKAALEPHPQRTLKGSKRENRPRDEQQGGQPQSSRQELQTPSCLNCRCLEDKLSALKQRFEHSQGQFLEHKAAIRILLTEARILPYTDLLDKVESFNKEIAAVADFLRNNIVYRFQEAFQEELDEAREEMEGVIGGHISALLLTQSCNAELGLTTPAPLFVEMVTKMLLVALCVSEISPRSAFVDVDEAKDANSNDLSSRDHHKLQPSTPPSAGNKFSASFLGKVSALFKTAAWAMPGTATRTEFVSRLKPLFVAKEDLRIALGEIFTSSKIELAIVNHDTSFRPEFMQDGYPGSEGKLVSGTICVGLKKVVEQDGCTPILRNIIPARVVLQSSLKNFYVRDVDQKEKGRSPQPASPCFDGREMK